jgi:hypothetical protein
MDILIILVVLLLLGGVAVAPGWGYNRDWGVGWFPTGGLLTLILILLVLRYAHVF